MSYDFQLFMAKPGLDPVSSYYIWQEEQENAEPTIASNKQIQLNQDALIKSLIANDTSLEPLIIGSSSSSANKNSHYVELTSAIGGLQIMIFEDNASVSIPYWHECDTASRVVQRVWNYLRIFQDLAELLVFDSQLERVLDLETDFPLVVHSYELCMQQVSRSFRK